MKKPTGCIGKVHKIETQVWVCVGFFSVGFEVRTDSSSTKENKYILERKGSFYVTVAIFEDSASMDLGVFHSF